MHMEAMDYVYAFIIGGLICVIGQLLISLTRHGGQHSGVIPIVIFHRLSHLIKMVSSVLWA